MIQERERDAEALTKTMRSRAHRDYPPIGNTYLVFRFHRYMVPCWLPMRILFK